MADKLNQIPENEFERLLKLSEYNIDYSEIYSKIDDLTKLAAYVTDKPISLVNILEANTQWTISSIGLEIHQTPREDTACQYVVLGEDSLEVEDMSQDLRFKDKHYVVQEPNIRYYFGVPLTTPDGIRIGAMCVMDTEISEINDEKAEYLKIIANQVMNCIESYQKIVLMRRAMEDLKEIQHKISHDIRGPIGGIMGIAEIIEEELNEGNVDEIPHFLDLIKNGGQSVLDLASEILSSYSKDSHQLNDTTSQKLTLVRLKEKLKNLYQPQAKVKSIKLKVDIGDENQETEFPKYNLMQIFGNLITNAIKFTPENGEVNVSMTLYETDQTLLTFKISDNGVGMTGEQLKAILSEHPKTTAGTNNERGFGFGFQLARHLTKNLNGKLNIDSEPGEGTTITVNIPVITE